MLARTHRPPPEAGNPAMERTLDPARLGDHLDRLYRAAWALSGSREELVGEDAEVRLLETSSLKDIDDLAFGRDRLGD